MYGSPVGRAIGVTTNIDGSIISVGIDRGYMGLLEVPFEHLVVQEDAIIYVPRWRLDSQKILREKAQIVRRLKALYALITNNDLEEASKAMRLNYESKLAELNHLEDSVRSIIDERLMELNLQIKTAKSMLFDANIQYKSSEMMESEFKKVKTGTGIVLERIDYEINEIKNQQRRLDELVSEEGELEDLRNNTKTKAEDEPSSTAEMIPQPEYPIPEPPQDPRAPKSNWLSRVNTQ